MLPFDSNSLLPWSSTRAASSSSPLLLSYSGFSLKNKTINTNTTNCIPARKTIKFVICSRPEAVTAWCFLYVGPSTKPSCTTKLSAPPIYPKMSDVIVLTTLSSFGNQLADTFAVMLTIMGYAIVNIVCPTTKNIK